MLQFIALILVGKHFVSIREAVKESLKYVIEYLKCARIQTCLVTY